MNSNKPLFQKLKRTIAKIISPWHKRCKASTLSWVLREYFNIIHVYLGPVSCWKTKVDAVFLLHTMGFTCSIEIILIHLSSEYKFYMDGQSRPKNKNIHLVQHGCYCATNIRGDRLPLSEVCWFLDFVAVVVWKSQNGEIPVLVELDIFNQTCSGPVPLQDKI